MAHEAHRRRVALILASILIPAFVFAFLGIQLYRQQLMLLHQLSASQPVTPLMRETNVRFAFYTCGFVFILALALGCRYLVWQDYLRDVRTARLRAEFVASVSHELRTPLTGIQMFAETLAMGRIADPERRQKYLETIARESRRLARLVDNVLEFSRRENGGISRARQPVQVASIIDSAIAALELSLAAGDFSIEREIPQRMAPIEVAPDAVEQAVLNLLSNAMKYSGDSRLIRVAATQTQQETRIDVCDSGSGIPVQYRQRIFDKFFRLPSSNRPADGVGLGLTVVKGIMEDHAGRVEVRDNPPRGSIFTLVFPTQANT